MLKAFVHLWECQCSCAG